MMRTPEIILLVVVALVVARAGTISREPVASPVFRRFDRHERTGLFVAGAGLAAAFGVILWRLIAP